MICYLKLHASSHKETWKTHYEKARRYLSEQIKDAGLEEELLKTCSNLVEEKIKHFFSVCILIVFENINLWLHQ